MMNDCKDIAQYIRMCLQNVPCLATFEKRHQMRSYNKYGLDPDQGAQ